MTRTELESLQVALGEVFADRAIRSEIIDALDEGEWNDAVLLITSALHRISMTPVLPAAVEMTPNGQAGHGQGILRDLRERGAL